MTDYLTLFGLSVGLVAMLGTAYGIGRKQVAASLNDLALEPVLHKIRNIEQWQEMFSESVERKYVTKEVLAPQLATITNTLARIEDRQEQLIVRFMSRPVA